MERETFPFPSISKPKDAEPRKAGFSIFIRRREEE